MVDGTLREPERELPVRASCDVLVCGGGVAGAAAAISAARNGMRVCLIEKNCALGGLATLGLICDFLPLCDGKGHQVIRGIAQEFFEAATRRGADPIPRCWQEETGSLEERAKQRLRAHFTPAWFRLELERMVEEAGVHVLYDTRLCRVFRRGNCVTAAAVENKDGRSAIRCGAMIDATGDADAVWMAGEETVSLRDNRRAGWFFMNEQGGMRLHIVGDRFFEPIPPGHPGFAGDDAQSVCAFLRDSRRLIADEVERLTGLPENHGAIPVLLPALPQMRKTRRLRGLHELTVRDGQYEADTIGMTGYYRRPGLVLCIPYGTLIGKTVENLFAAGRCISCEEDAWNITRGIPSCCITGQAAGVAASLCVSARQPAQSMDLGRLRQRLKEQGAYLPE